MGLAEGGKPEGGKPENLQTPPPNNLTKRPYTPGIEPEDPEVRGKIQNVMT